VEGGEFGAELSEIEGEHSAFHATDEETVGGLGSADAGDEADVGDLESGEGGAVEGEEIDGGVVAVPCEDLVIGEEGAGGTACEERLAFLAPETFP
jgi:hypothetical protein